MNIFTADKETGTIIDEFKTYEEAKAAIEAYEDKDRAGGVYTDDFYDIVDEEHRSLDTIKIDGKKIIMTKQDIYNLRAAEREAQNN